MYSRVLKVSLYGIICIKCFFLYKEKKCVRVYHSYNSYNVLHAHITITFTQVFILTDIPGYCTW